MKIVTVVPVADDKPTLKALLLQKERELSGKGTTFIRQGKGRRVHLRYRGSINWDLAKGGILIADISSRRPDSELQLLQAFIGYLDRYLGEYIGSITITCR